MEKNYQRKKKIVNLNLNLRNSIAVLQNTNKNQLNNKISRIKNNMKNINKIPQKNQIIKIYLVLKIKDQNI